MMMNPCSRQREKSCDWTTKLYLSRPLNMKLLLPVRKVTSLSICELEIIMFQWADKLCSLSVLSVFFGCYLFFVYRILPELNN